MEKEKETELEPSLQCLLELYPSGKRLEIDKVRGGKGSST